MPSWFPTFDWEVTVLQNSLDACQDRLAVCRDDLSALRDRVCSSRTMIMRMIVV